MSQHLGWRLRRRAPGSPLTASIRVALLPLLSLRLGIVPCSRAYAVIQPMRAAPDLAAFDDHDPQLFKFPRTHGAPGSVCTRAKHPGLCRCGAAEAAAANLTRRGAAREGSVVGCTVHVCMHARDWWYARECAQPPGLRARGGARAVPVPGLPPALPAPPSRAACMARSCRRGTSCCTTPAAQATPQGGVEGRS